METTSEERSISLELTADEANLVRTALGLLVATLGREEADELAEVQAILARLNQMGG
jgi:hypothetical protein